MKDFFEIVCIDDEDDILQIYSEYLSGFNLKTFNNPEHALEYIKKNASRIAFCLSDYRMKEMNGFDLREKMLPDFADIPYVVITGNFSPEMTKKAFDIKIASLLEKPFTKAQLLAEFDRHGKARIAQVNEEIEMVVSFVNE